MGCYFAQMMFDNSHAEYPYFIYNYDFYPNRDQQTLFFAAYVAQFREESASRVNCCATDSDPNYYMDLERLRIESNAFALASLLFYAFRAIYQLYKKYGYTVNHFESIFVEINYLGEYLI